MPITAQFLKNIMTEARPIIERQMNDAKVIAGFRSVVANAGGDWGALKALIKAHIEDENDESGDGQRVHKILEKADCTSAYADMLGLANMNENNFSSGEITEPENQSEQPCTATGPSASTGNAPAEIPATEFQAKASEDNGATGTAIDEVPSDSMTGEVSRSSDRDECGAATSENGRDSRERPAQVSPSDHVSEPAVAKPQAPQTATADQSPDPQSSTAADGQRGIQSSAADGAKSDVSYDTSSVGTAQADRHSIKAEQAVTLSPSSEASSLPLTTTGADAPPPVSAPTNSEKPHCLKLRDGECRQRFETTALCHECNAEKMKVRAA